MQSLNMENFQENRENSLLDLSFENIGSSLATESALGNKFGTEENREDLLYSSSTEPEVKSKDGDVFDECIPMVNSTYGNEKSNDRNETFSVVDQVPAASQNVPNEFSHSELNAEIESDYMNPYADIRSQKEEKPTILDESAAAPFSVATVELEAEPDNNVASKGNVSQTLDKVLAKPEIKATKECIKIEQMFKDYGLDAWFNPTRLHPKVESLIYWRDIKKSAVVFGGGLAILLAMSLFSLISVFSYLSLLLLFGTISFRIYKNVLQAVQKTSEGHPFKEYLDMDLTLSQEKVQQLATFAVAHMNALLTGLRRLFLVEDLVDSIKFGVLLYWLTYVGAIFNGITCVMIGFVALFTLPKVYENNKQSIDTHIEIVRSKIQEITEKVKAAIPLGKKTETEKNK
ncbi:reticulon-1 isoform X1 [Anopheles maculipalpis]|uniref:reticulon-1 isoform X1 n=1 Tax=Anopheles maculipalpis TaxID=1496333 RepID=UPI0021599EA0|nr:reticulon-1 isoform X1 [Anopheles maculipalpis]